VGASALWDALSLDQNRRTRKPRNITSKPVSDLKALAVIATFAGLGHQQAANLDTADGEGGGMVL